MATDQISRVDEWASGPTGRLTYNDPLAPHHKIVRGCRLTLTSGAIWFHPYDGTAPTKLED